MMHENDPKCGVWLVLVTHPHREPQAIENLMRQNFRAYCPMTAKRIHHARRVHDAQRPLFPGYVFVEWPSQWRPLLGTIGVRSVVMSDRKPAKLPLGFVESLKARELDGVIGEPEMAFRIGQQVTIQGGAFDGLIGQIIEMRSNDRVLVLLDLLNRQTPVHIDARQLV
jgi:transcriptional antiterminator RfaH